jgi:hypothetical protein
MVGSCNDGSYLLLLVCVKLFSFWLGFGPCEELIMCQLLCIVGHGGLYQSSQPSSIVQMNFQVTVCTGINPMCPGYRYMYDLRVRRVLQYKG